ncbi:unnamed protein product, partial [Staurois parvus]
MAHYSSTDNNDGTLFLPPRTPMMGHYSSPPLTPTVGHHSSPPLTPTMGHYSTP